MRVLGISAYYHDSAAALVADGDIVAAAQEERFTRKKHDPGFPRHAIEYCLREGGITLDDVDHIVFYDKPLLKFERLLETYLAFAPRGFKSFSMAIPVWLKEKLFLKLSAHQGVGAAGHAQGPGRAHALFGAPPEPRGERLLPVAVRRGGRADDGRRGRVGDDLAGARQGQPARGAARDPLPAFARAAVLGLHLLHRLQGQLGRVQGDGPGALRRAASTRA